MVDDPGGMCYGFPVMRECHFKREHDPQIQEKTAIMLNIMGGGERLPFSSDDGSLAGEAVIDAESETISLELVDGSTVENFLVDEFISGDFGITVVGRIGEKSVTITMNQPLEQDDRDPELEGFGKDFSRELKLRAVAIARMKFSYSFLGKALGGRMVESRKFARQTRASMRNILTPDFFRSLNRETLAALGFRFVEQEELNRIGFEWGEMKRGAMALFPADLFFLLPNSFKGMTLAAKPTLREELVSTPMEFGTLLVDCMPFGFVLEE